MKALLAFLTFATLTSTAGAAVTVTSAGQIGYGQIVKTVDAPKGLVCFTVNGSEGIATACVKRAVQSGTLNTVVGTIGYGEIKTLTDSVFNVVCAVSRGAQGAAISCQ